MAVAARVGLNVRPKRKCRSFDSAEVRCAQDDSVVVGERTKGKCRSFDSAEVRFARDDRFLVGKDEEQKQAPIRLRSGQAFGSAEVRFDQDDRSYWESKMC